MNDPGVIQQECGQRLQHQKPYAVRSMGIKDTGLTALDTLTSHQHDHDKIHAITVRAFWRRTAHATCGIYTKLMCLNMPARNGFDPGKQQIGRASCRERVLMPV